VDISHGAQMIVSFSVSNFRSFSSEETFSLTASNRLTNHASHTVSIPDSDQKVLRAGVLYGANGAGKSNLFKALQYMKTVAVKWRGKDQSMGRETFRLGKSADEPSTFDLQFIVANKLYRFGFKANDQHITEEWLVRMSGGRETILYERETKSDGKVAVDAPGLKSLGKTFNAIVTVGGPNNQSFLSTITTMLNKEDYGEELESIRHWFSDDLKLIAPDSSFMSLGAYFADDPEHLKFASDFLKSVSTGVDQLDIKENLSNFLPEKVASSVRSELHESKCKSVLIRTSMGDEMLVRKASGDHCVLLSLRATHKGATGKDIEFELHDESDGTRRLLNLVPALYGLGTSNEVYFIDEVERSLHPNLAWEFMKFFLRSCSECHAQIIVTTHDTNLLDQELLRRDEIWFAEKDHGSATRLYSLMDFKERNDSRISEHYLQGRFGAVPFMGDLDRLLEKEGQNA
jgi:AAA15 family ATPase/GTPase